MFSISKKVIVFFAACFFLLTLLFNSANKEETSKSSVGKELLNSIRLYKNRLDEESKGVGSEMLCSEIEHNPVDSTLKNLMKDFGEHECHGPNGLSLTSKGNNLVEVSAYQLNFVNLIAIQKKGDTFELGKKKLVTKLEFPDTVLNNRSSGVFVNDATNVCMKPSGDNLQFSTDCLSKEAHFEITKEGYMQHKASKKCFGLGPNSELKNDAPVVLSKECQFKFEVVFKGVLKTNNYCIHPLGGGDPSDGQKLCYWQGCEDTKRLRYHINTAVEDKLVTRQFKIENEHNLMEYKMADRKTYSGFFSSIQPKDLNNFDLASPSQPNIFVITLDEASSGHIQRKLPKSWEYLLNEMKSQVYPFYAAILDQSVENINSMLTGNKVTMSDKEKSKNLFSLEAGRRYATFYSSDTLYEGLVNVTSDHSTTTFFKVLNKYYDIRAKHYCVGEKGIYDITLDFMSDFIKKYPLKAKFAAVILSQITQYNYNLLGYMDDSLVKILQEIHQLPNTILILNSIKGNLIGKLGQTKEGLAEYKRPLLSVYVSKDLQQKYKLNLERTSQIVSPFDVHATVKELLNGKPYSHKFGLSLFNQDPLSKRDCLNAGVSQEMCPCKV